MYRPIRRPRPARRRVTPLTAALTLLVPLMPAAALAVAAPGTALAASPAQQQVYVLDEGSNGNTYTMNVLNAASPGTLVSQTSLPQVSNTDNGVTVAPDSSAVFTSGSPSSNGFMYTFNPLTAAATLIGTDVGSGDTALSPDGSTLYIAGLLGIDEYHPATGTTTKDAIHLTGLTSGLAVSPDGSTLYAASNANDNVSVLNAATGAVSSTIPLASAASAELLSPDGSRLYVWGNQVGTVTVINTASDTVAATITIPGGKMNFNQTGCISPDGSTLYVPGPPGQGTNVISTATDTITSTIKPSQFQPDPNACAVSPDGSQLWVAYQNPSSGGGVGIFSTSSGNALLGKGPTSVTSPVEVVFGPDQAPNAALSVTPGPQYQATQFDASASTVPYGSIASYAWTFGDGATATTTTPTTSHVYTSQGPFTATVTETDGLGTSTSATTVRNGIENIRSGGPQAAVSKSFTVPPPGPGTVSGTAGYTGTPGCDGNPVTGTAPLAGATVSELASDGTLLGSSATGSDGSYSVAGRSEPGLQLQVSGSGLNPSLPDQFSLVSGGVTVSGSATQNLTLPSPVFENVTVTDTTGHPVAGATVSEAAADPTAPIALFPGATAEPGAQSATPQTTGGGGQATLCLYPSPAAHLTAAGPTGQGSATADTSGGSVTIQVPTQPSVGVSSSLPTSTYAQPVTFTAAVGANGSGGPVPTGTVTFSVDGTPQAPVAVSPSGQATLTTSTLPGGVHTITAAYSGDSVYAADTSSAIQQTVLPAGTSTTLASTEMPSVTGQAGTITATVAAGPGQGTPTGTVTFTVDGSERPAVTLARGKASIKLASLPVGTHSVAAVYSGDGNRASSTSSALTQVVNPAATSAAVTTTGTPSAFGHGKLTATVKATAPGTGTPTGTVTFSVDGVPGQPAVLTAGKATMPMAALSAGTHQVTVTYSGDASYQGSTSAALTQVVNQAAATVTLTSSQNPVTQGGAGSVTAKIAGVPLAAGTPTGTVTFSVDGVSRPPLTLSAFGTARLRLAILAPGSHTITATYSGDANHAGATSGPLIQVVNAPAQMIRRPGWAGTEISLRP
jgi:YVTN family beta-propeller protein